MREPCGCVSGATNRLTSKELPKAIGVTNVNGPLLVNGKLSPPLSCKTPLAVSPVGRKGPTMFPPMVLNTAGQTIATPVTFDVAVPLPIDTVHTCAGFDGCVRIVTL